MTFQLRMLGHVEITDSHGDPVDAVVRQPKRMALLAYLAAKRPSPVESRDILLNIFWPDLDEAHARNALNKGLHFLRRTLGEGLVVSHGRTRVGIDPALVTCDAVDFRDHLKCGAPERALGLYLGDLLPGLYVTDAAPFGQWVDEERDWYRERARDAAFELLERDLERGRARSAVEWSAVLDRISPNDEGVVRAAVTVLLTAGDRPAALQRLERYESWLRDELGTGVPADLVRLLAKRVTPVHRVPEPPVTDPPAEILEEVRRAIRVESLEEYRSMVDTLPDMVYRCDIRGSFPFVNQAVVDSTGFSREELREMQFAELVRDDFRDRVVEFYLAQIDGRIPVTYLEFPAVRKDGTEFWVGQRVRLLERDGEPMGIEAVTRDISTRVRREVANRRTALEDLETRVLNRDAFAVMGHQRIRESRRSGETFFTVHVRLSGGGEQVGREEAGRAVRALSGLLKAAIRESDAIGRIDELELVVLAPVGGPDEAAATRLRVEDEIDGAAEMSELQEFHIHCEAVVHDPKVIASSDALMTFAWVVEG